MEEIPRNPNTPAPEAELSPPDPEKIGDLLLRLPQPERARPTPIVDEQAPKIVISRDKLRDRIERYKELKFGRPKEAAPETKPEEELTEAHFERRHEIRDETKPEKPKTEEVEQTITPDETIQEPVPTPAQAPPAMPPPLMPDALAPGEPAKLNLPNIYKKPLILGLFAGALTGAVLIFIFLR